MVAPVPMDIGLIYPKVDGRPLIRPHVVMLAESLRAIGLQSPITVRPCQRIRDGREADAFEIVAGRHRYEAALSLSWTTIDAVVMDASADDAELWEIDENFARADLTEAQRADHHVRRMRILLAKGIINGRGGDRKSNSKDGSLKSYVSEAAAATGSGYSTVARDLARGQKIDPEILSQITGTELDKGVILDELARVPADRQSEKLAEIAARRSLVRPAPDPLNDPEAHERQLAALMSAWNRAAAVVREEFLLRVDLPVFDRGGAGA